MPVAPMFGRRAVLGGLAAGAALILTGCTGSGTDPVSTTAANPVRMPAGGGRILIAYFSRPGENYYYGGRRNLEVGNTEVLAGMLADRTGGQRYRIQPVDPYPADYDGAVERNRREQDQDALPAISGALPDMGEFDTVLLGSPVWNSQATRIMSTFIQALDFTGKTVLPFVTYAVSGISSIDDFYRRNLPGATVTDGLAVRGEEVSEATGAVETWLRTHNLLTP
ncbi:hypothetical protein OH799_11620 [Nocardia sp. NBC_00881]|uniref:flavodoxin n=1 Tax=Nocardia sp. NBC_00881 TaxID=2975995 RepID=UPI003863F16D|nr:hypothetical protein OH799_11620 [Nocardia sp. NBC_00881]